ncbi:UDP-N-acetylglucosamine--N-acetylmuramyl-(pentapeptide) pyrophosphoryl-undecaprenol N-acetylglucosamine transferase [Thermoflexales bacterium]|nr:UDP-N-acetylglucosamine--N-acetylmuramyl-(pentapeptide) pyrophosphoryl-undecaprenol N-acetylglucosamine transferase [Thermoflexales bacterium]
MEQALVERAGIPFKAIPAGGLHGVGIGRMARNTLKLAAGMLKAWQLIGRHRPQAMLTTGGFVSAPVALACWLRRVPILLYLPDIEPGLAVKFVARFASKIAVTTEESIRYFPAHKVIVTGYPTRAGFAQADRLAAHRKFELAEDRKTLLVFGGSKGARSINRALVAVVEPLLMKYQIIHISGSTDAGEVQARRAALPEELKRHYHVFEYVHEMGLAFAAADLVVSRAGASILGEYPLFGLSSILIPYPYAWRYQKVNADYLVAHGAALRLDDETLSETLQPTIERLLSDEVQLSALSHAAQSLRRPDPAVKLAQTVQELAAV